MPLADTINSLETPGSRRKDKINEAIQSMANLNSNMEALELPSDPDAQATVTDFLDFTEYLPSDMVRSFTLIRDLDETYLKAYSGVDGLTKTYGKLPQLPTDGKPDPVKLRTDISQNLSEATRARVLASTEAIRMSNNVDRHYNRAKNILAKLQAMAEAYPPSREPSPVSQKTKSPVVSRPPKITLRVNDRSGGEPSVRRVRKHRAPRITVPGEVLAPYELDYESYDSESDSGESADDEPLTPRQTPARTLSASNTGGRIKLKIQKQPKSRTPRPSVPRPPRPPGVMGTNVHSAVAGISTSNALAMLKPPPPGTEPGSADAPWLQLTDWELGMLRKRMKKNAVWSPSDTMIARELKLLGRGIEAYRTAKKHADDIGHPMAQPVPPQLLGQRVDAEGAISVEAVRADQENPQLVNRGMKLNEAKKLKKEAQAKELAKAAEEAEESARKMSEAAQAMKDLFSAPADDQDSAKKTPARRTAAQKRKRPQSNVDSDVAERVDGESVKIEQSEKPQVKRNKTETPIPAPQTLSARGTKQATPASIADSTAPSRGSRSSEAPILPGDFFMDSISAPEPSTKRVSAPILPAGKEAKKDAKKPTEKPANTRPSRSSTVKTPTPATTPTPDALPTKRPTSSRSKAASQEPVFQTGSATIDRPRRTSTARNTPAPPPVPLEGRQASKRTKRPAPGVVTTASEGSTSVSVGKRSSATRKRPGAKKEKKDGREGSVVQEVDIEYDDEGNIISPDEPRYCLCNRVSFGMMVACENNEVRLVGKPVLSKKILIHVISARKNGSIWNALI
jgi:hypothetical protein